MSKRLHTGHLSAPVRRLVVRQSWACVRYAGISKVCLRTVKPFHRLAACRYLCSHILRMVRWVSMLCADSTVLLYAGCSTAFELHPLAMSCIVIPQRSTRVSHENHAWKRA